MIEVRYLFGRLSVIANPDDKMSYFIKTLNSSHRIEKNRSFWGFFDVNTLTSSEGEFFSGFLVKYKKAVAEEIVDRESRSIIDIDVEFRVLAKSRFFLHFKTGMIAYHPVGNTISKEQFRENYCELFEKANGGLFVAAKMTSLLEQYKILESLKSFQRIDKINFHLRPSNPTNRDEWKEVDDMLHRLDAGYYDESFISKPGSTGLHNVIEEPVIKQKTHMSEDGYGETKVTGKRNGEIVTISSEDNPISQKAPNDDHESITVLDKLIGKFRSVIERFER